MNHKTSKFQISVFLFFFCSAFYSNKITDEANWIAAVYIIENSSQERCPYQPYPNQQEQRLTIPMGN